jgi:hypothetical protein
VDSQVCAAAARGAGLVSFGQYKQRQPGLERGIQALPPGRPLVLQPVQDLGTAGDAGADVAGQAVEFGPDKGKLRGRVGVAGAAP